MQLSLGRRRALQQCAQSDGTFAMLAIDQRGSLIKAMRSDSGTASYAEVISLKKDIVSTVSPFSSATLVDPEYGYPASVASDSFPGHVGMLIALEKSGYEGDPTERRTALLEDWSVEKIRRAGGSGVKILVYYRPDAGNASDQEELIAEVADQCHKVDLPLFVEPLHYSLDPNVKVVPNAERRELVVKTAQRLVPMGIDVLKAEFPVDINQTDDEAEWADACAELSDAASGVPWVLLSAGVDYDTYIRQVKVACMNGASGILCGRAVWKETVPMPVAERREFLRTVSIPRFERLRHMVSAFARPFTDFYPTSSGEELEDWYKK